MKIILVHRNGGPKVAKIAESLLSAGHIVICVNWDRNRKYPNRLFIPATQHLTCFSPNGVSALQSLWQFSSFIINVLFAYHPDVVHCVNEEMAALVLPFKHVLYKQLVCDVFDKISDRVQFSGVPLRGLLEILVWIVYAISDGIIVTDERRYKRLGRFKSKAIIVENSPVDPGSDLAFCFPEGEVTVFLSGGISKRRGCEIAIAALDQSPGVKMVAAGWLDESVEPVLIHHPRVTYLGVLTPRESLDCMARADAALAFYEPSSRNNIFASPSKIFDAMSVGRPVIINAEAKASEWVHQRRLGFVVPYFDVGALARVFNALSEFRAQLPEFAPRVRALYLKEYSWPIMETRLLKMYAQIETKLHPNSVGTRLSSLGSTSRKG